MNAKEAIYCWNPGTGEAKLVQFPDAREEARDFWTSGAVYTAYRGVSALEQVTTLLIEAWESVIRDGILPDMAFKTIMEVDEVNAMFAEDVPYKKEEE